MHPWLVAAAPELIPVLPSDWWVNPPSPRPRGRCSLGKVGDPWRLWAKGNVLCIVCMLRVYKVNSGLGWSPWLGLYVADLFRIELFGPICLSDRDAYLWSAWVVANLAIWGDKYSYVRISLRGLVHRNGMFYCYRNRPWTLSRSARGWINISFSRTLISVLYLAAVRTYSMRLFFYAPGLTI